MRQNVRQTYLKRVWNEDKSLNGKFDLAAVHKDKESSVDVAKEYPIPPFLAVCSYPVYPSSLRGRVNIIDAISQPLSTESTDDAPLRTDCQNLQAKCLVKKGVVIFCICCTLIAY